MRLKMIQSRYVKTTTHRLETRFESASHRCRNHRYPTVEGRPSRVAACLHWYHSGTNGLFAWSGTGFGASAATTISPDPAGACAAPQEVGWTATGVAELGGGRSLPRSVGRTGAAGGGAGGFPSAGGVGGKIGPENRPLGDVPPFGTARVAESCPDTRHPKCDPGAQAEWKKNSPKCWQPG
jgi:hypothetical protein